MNNNFEIESILKDLYKTVKTYNNNFKLEPRVVYHYLIKRDVKKNDLKQMMNYMHSDISLYNSESNLFRKWITKFKNKSNIKVFCSDSWKYFCQFVNGDFVKSYECIKMYIPLDYDHIYEGVNRIFDFLADNNIVHVSKVSSKIRFDDVVIRLNNMEDAKKLQQFIDNDKYIQEGLIKNNAFAFNNNGISYAYDGRLSYNSYISSVVADYINIMASKSEFSENDVTFSNFYNYVENISNDIYKINSLLDYNDKDEKLIDAYFIVQFFKRRLKTNNIKDYEDLYNQARDIETWNKVDSYIEDGNKKVSENDIFKNNNDDKKQLFDELILTTMKKYPLGYDETNDYLSGWDYIISFLNGNIKSVTRDNNLRDRVSKNLSKEDAFDIINNSGIMGNNIKDKLNNYIKMIMFNEVIRCSSIRDPKYFAEGLNRFMATNDNRYITNKVGRARSLARTLQGPDMKNFLEELGVNGIYDYMDKYYNNDINRGYERR